MGIDIQLTIAPSMIEPEQWARAFDDVAALWSRFPGGLLCPDVTRRGAFDLGVYSRRIERRQDERHFLCVCGDATSLRTAEAFEVHRDLGYYVSQTRGQPSSEQQDVLLGVLRATAAGPGHFTVSVFNEKTQGEPYHDAILAAGILLESRLPFAVHLNGGLSLAQAKRAIQFVDGGLLPLCLDRARLMQRIQRLQLDDPEAAFDELHRDSEQADRIVGLWRRLLGDDPYDRIRELWTCEGPTRYGWFIDEAPRIAWKVHRLAKEFDKRLDEVNELSTEQSYAFEGQERSWQRMLRTLQNPSVPSSEEWWLNCFRAGLQLSGLRITEAALDALEGLPSNALRRLAPILACADRELAWTYYLRAMLENPKVRELIFDMADDAQLMARVEAEQPTATRTR